MEPLAKRPKTSDDEIDRLFLGLEQQAEDFRKRPKILEKLAELQKKLQEDLPYPTFFDERDVLQRIICFSRPRDISSLMRTCSRLKKKICDNTLHYLAARGFENNFPYIIEYNAFGQGYITSQQPPNFHDSPIFAVPLSQVVQSPFRFKLLRIQIKRGTFDGIISEAYPEERVSQADNIIINWDLLRALCLRVEVYFTVLDRSKLNIYENFLTPDITTLGYKRLINPAKQKIIRQEDFPILRQIENLTFDSMTFIETFIELKYILNIPKLSGIKVSLEDLDNLIQAFKFTIVEFKEHVYNLEDGITYADLVSQLNLYKVHEKRRKTTWKILTKNKSELKIIYKTKFPTKIWLKRKGPDGDFEEEKALQRIVDNSGRSSDSGSEDEKRQRRNQPVRANLDEPCCSKSLK